MKITKNGTQLVKEAHIFIEQVAGERSPLGTFFRHMADAEKSNYSPNGVGLVTDTIEYEGAIWYQCHYTNVFD